MRVLISRTPESAAALTQGLCRGAQEHGLSLELIYAPVHQAVLRQPEHWSQIRQALLAGDYAWVTITSANTVRALVELAGEADRTLAGLLEHSRLACVGRATAQHLTAAGRVPELVPSQQDARGLIAQLPPPRKPGERILVLQGNLARPTLAEGLVHKGYEVDIATVYDMEPYPAPCALVPESKSTAKVLRTATARKEVLRCDALVLTAPSILTALTQGYAASLLPPVVATGATTAHAAQEVGLEVVTSPSPHPHDLAATTLTLLTDTIRRTPCNR